MFYVLLILGVISRLILIPVPGFKADVAFWKGWGLAMADKGIIWLVNNTNYNYPPGFAYVLWLINKIYALFKSPYNISEYWADNNVFYLFLIKIITISADLLIVWLIIKIGGVILNGVKRSEGSLANARYKAETSSEIPRFARNDKLPKIFALFYFLNPAVIYDGVVWGQVDQFGLALFLLGVYLVLINKPSWGSAVFMVSCLMKFQNIIFIPLFYLYIFKKHSFKKLISSLISASLTFLIVIAPFLINKQLDKLIGLLTINIDWFPWYSLNAFNGWWIAAGLDGMKLVDKHLVFGITSAKQFGFILFIFAYFISSVTVFFSSKENLFRNFLLACSLAVFAFFHLLTQSHERYLFPVMGLLPILFIYLINSKLQETRNKQIFVSWELGFGILLSIFFFLNMYLSMGWNYPDQVIPPFTVDQTLGMSLIISIIQIVLFAIFLVWYLKKSQIRHFGLIGLMGIILTANLLLKNSGYFLGKPVALTKLTPISYKQDYLSPSFNKTVESGRGVKFWNRLSVNYYFYDKGIGSHADSEITYHLGKRFSQFSTDFGIDTEGHESAKVYFSILGDGRVLFRSEVKGRFDPPGTTKVNVKGVNYLTLKISKAGESNFGAHADWLNPVLIRSN